MKDEPDWWSRALARLLPSASEDKPGAAPDSAENKKKTAAAERSTHARLQATLRRGQEALSPRALRRVLGELQAVVQPRTSEVEGGRSAQALAEWYAQAPAPERRDLWLLMSEQFAPDATRFESARKRYEAAAGTPEEGQAEVDLRRALESPRTRLLQRFAV